MGGEVELEMAHSPAKICQLIAPAGYGLKHTWFVSPRGLAGVSWGGLLWLAVALRCCSLKTAQVARVF